MNPSGLRRGLWVSSSLQPLLAGKSPEEVSPGARSSAGGRRPRAAGPRRRPSRATCPPPRRASPPACLVFVACSEGSANTCRETAALCGPDIRNSARVVEGEQCFLRSSDHRVIFGVRHLAFERDLHHGGKRCGLADRDAHVAIVVRHLENTEDSFAIGAALEARRGRSGRDAGPSSTEAGIVEAAGARLLRSAADRVKSSSRRAKARGCRCTPFRRACPQGRDFAPPQSPSAAAGVPGPRRRSS